jgi:beta-glucosidase
VFPAAAAEPPRVLRGFAKVVLAPGATRRVTLSLPPSAFQYWDTTGQRWQTAPGDYTVQVGQNSRDLPLYGTVSAADLAAGTAP